MTLSLPDLPAPLDFMALFGRSAPVEIEIGVGKGRFLREYALANPGLNLIGIEKSPKWLRHTQERLTKAGVTNVRLIVGYAETFLSAWIVESSIRAVHVYFPDPWPKRRHGKRRLFTPGFLSEVARVLCPGGMLSVASDHEGYFRAITGLLGDQKSLVSKETSRGDYTSNFQAKYEREGRAIRFAVAYRQAQAVAESVSRPG